jgi:hypothetical protein
LPDQWNELLLDVTPGGGLPAELEQLRHPEFVVVTWRGS